jgi:hypothetical protein
VNIPSDISVCSHTHLCARSRAFSRAENDENVNAWFPSAPIELFSSSLGKWQQWYCKAMGLEYLIASWQAFAYKRSNMNSEFMYCILSALIAFSMLENKKKQTSNAEITAHARKFGQEGLGVSYAVFSFL